MANTNTNTNTNTDTSTKIPCLVYGGCFVLTPCTGLVEICCLKIGDLIYVINLSTNELIALPIVKLDKKAHCHGYNVAAGAIVGADTYCINDSSIGGFAAQMVTPSIIGDFYTIELDSKSSSDLFIFVNETPVRASSNINEINLQDSFNNLSI